MLAEADPTNAARYGSMMSDAADFLRVGLEGCFDHYSPEPSGDGCWHRVDAAAQTLETTLTLGREPPLMADYVYALRSKTDSLSRHKAARR